MLPSHQLSWSLLVLGLLSACAPGPDEAPASDAGAPRTPAGQAPAALELPALELLTHPDDPQMNLAAPATFQVLFETTRGEFVIEAHRDWAPLGADRFYNLCRAGYFDGIKLFRVVSGFMAQFGIHGDPEISKHWMTATIRDDPVQQSNARGFVSYAMGGPNTRSTQLFINYGNNQNLDSQGFAPFGRVVRGMEVVDGLFSEYGERTTSTQGAIYQQGNAFLDSNFPKLDSIVTARLID